MKKLNRHCKEYEPFSFFYDEGWQTSQLFFLSLVECFNVHALKLAHSIADA